MLFLKSECMTAIYTARSSGWPSLISRGFLLLTLKIEILKDLHPFFHPIIVKTPLAKPCARHWLCTCKYVVILPLVECWCHVKETKLRVTSYFHSSFSPNPAT